MNSIVRNLSPGIAARRRGTAYSMTPAKKPATSRYSFWIVSGLHTATPARYLGECLFKGRRKVLSNVCGTLDLFGKD